MQKSVTYYSALIVAVLFPGFANLAHASDAECPAALADSLDTNYGPGTLALTQCLSKKNVQVVVQINRFCADNVANADCTRPYALGTIQNMIEDYQLHGMQPEKDYQIMVIVHGGQANGGGAGLVLKDMGYDGDGNPVSGRNQFESTVQSLLAQPGVRFYVSLRSINGLISQYVLPTLSDTTGGATAELIDGVGYVTTGATAIADYQSNGYTYIQP